MDALVTGSIVVTVRLFAMLRERAGDGALELEIEDGATVDQALDRLAEERPVGELLRRMPVRTAVNREYADGATVLSAGDELAVIPPVSGGGEARVHVCVTGERLAAERLRRLVDDPRAGAAVVFEGVTREVQALDYEAYTEMAEREIARVLQACVERHGLLAAAAEHRTGRVALGEPSVIVAVSAPHRGEAFAGAREAIDEIKERAPIWKREQRGEGPGEWVEGAAPRTALHVEHERDEAAESGLDRGGR
jgi:molybdopterin synthase catalytic subunit